MVKLLFPYILSFFRHLLYSAHKVKSDFHAYYLNVYLEYEITNA